MTSAVAHHRTAATAKPSRPIPIGRWLLNGAAAIALGFILLPLLLVTWLAFFPQEIPSFPPEGYSLQWFAAVPVNKPFVNGFILSFQVGVTATVIVGHDPVHAPGQLGEQTQLPDREHQRSPACPSQMLIGPDLEWTDDESGTSGTRTVWCFGDTRDGGTCGQQVTDIGQSSNN